MSNTFASSGARVAHIEYDNTNLTNIPIQSLWNNNLLHTIVVTNNQNLIRIYSVGDGNTGSYKSPFTKIDFSNNPLLNNISIKQQFQSIPKEGFIAFVNTLPQRENNNRGTLSMRNNPYISDVDVLAILASKNWDYNAWS